MTVAPATASVPPVARRPSGRRRVIAVAVAWVVFWVPGVVLYDLRYSRHQDWFEFTTNAGPQLFILCGLVAAAIHGVSIGLAVRDVRHVRDDAGLNALLWMLFIPLVQVILLVFWFFRGFLYIHK